MIPGRPDPVRRIRAAAGFFRTWCAILADPDRHGYRERSIAWLALALLVSAAAHLALLSTLALLPRQYGADLRLPLRASLRAAPAESIPVSMPAEPALPDLPPPPAAAAESREPAVASPASPSAPESPRADGGPPITLPERYFVSRDLDTPAQALGRAPLIYPQGAYHHRVRGTVRLRVFIGADGSVEQLEVVSVDPPGQHFEAAALEAMRLMRYSPAIKDGQKVRSRKVIEVSFDPEDPGQVAGKAN